MNESDIKSAARIFVEMKAEYAPPEDTIFDRDEPRVSAVKRILAGLDTADRAIFTLYTDMQSLRKVADLIGVSKASVHKEVKRIQKQILREYENLH